MSVHVRFRDAFVSTLVLILVFGLGRSGVAQDPDLKLEPKVFVEEALLLINAPPGETVPADEDVRKARGEAAMKLATSDSIRDKVLKGVKDRKIPFFKDRKDLAEWYEQNVNVTLSKNGSVLRIAVTAPDRAAATLLAQSAAQVLFTEAMRENHQKLDEQANRSREVAESLRRRLDDQYQLIRSATLESAKTRIDREEAKAELRELRREIRALSLQLVEADIHFSRLTDAQKEAADQVKARSLYSSNPDAGLRSFDNRRKVIRAQRESLEREEAKIREALIMNELEQERLVSIQREISRLEGQYMTATKEIEKIEFSPREPIEILFLPRD